MVVAMTTWTRKAAAAPAHTASGLPRVDMTKDANIVLSGSSPTKMIGNTAAATAKFMPDDFRVSITNPEGKAAYPIASFTWLLIPAKFGDSAKRDAVKDFLKWMLTDGQQYCEGLSYAKLPKEVVAKETKAIALIQ